MYLLNNWHKLLFAAAVALGYFFLSGYLLDIDQVEKTDAAVKAVSDTTGRDFAGQRREAVARNAIYAVGWIVPALIVLLTFSGDLRRRLEPKKAAVSALAIIALSLTGCIRPMEPIDLQEIHPNEVAFVIPLTGDAKKQAASSNEQWYKENLVHIQQVKIPYQWVPKGFERFGPNGDWKRAAMLIRVSTTPVTREWTADPTTGSSSKNEAVWVMTSDQVEFSTGWTITARVKDQAGAIKFLANYPNGGEEADKNNTAATGLSLQKILDNEVRGRLQADFGLEVTDLPMEELKKNSTPHIKKVVEEVKTFFDERGITVTNLGITGGFVYKNPTIMSKIVETFNAEQEKAIAVAKKQAQDENNKTVISEAQGRADAILKTKKAEADGVKMVADARFYEIEKAAQKPEIYMALKQLELQRELLAKWDGSYPRYFMGGSGQTPNMLLQLPAIDSKK